MDDFTIETETAPTASGDVTILRVQGHLDAYTAPRLMRCLDEQIAENNVRLVLDCEGLSYMSSAGFGVLAAAKRQVNSRNGDLLVANLPPKIRSIFDNLGLSNLLKVFNNRSDAIDFFAMGDKK